MPGNAWEWMDSWYDKDQTGRVLRGGSWDNRSIHLRCAARSNDNPLNYWYCNGFRVVFLCSPSHRGENKNDE